MPHPVPFKCVSPPPPICVPPPLLSRAPHPESPPPPPCEFTSTWRCSPPAFHSPHVHLVIRPPKRHPPLPSPRSPPPPPPHLFGVGGVPFHALQPPLTLPVPCEASAWLFPTSRASPPICPGLLYVLPRPPSPPHSPPAVRDPFLFLHRNGFIHA